MSRATHTAHTAHTPASAALDYAPGQPARRRRRNRWILKLLIALALLAAVVWLGPSLYRKAVLPYWERQVKAYHAPADRVVYEEDPAHWPALLAHPAYRTMPASSPGWNSYVGYMADPVSRLAAAGKLRIGPSAVFAHARKTPSGRERIVVVWLASNGVRCNARGASPDNQVQLDLNTSVWDGRRLRERRLFPWIAPRSVAENRDTPVYLRLYAGQPDPSDPARFTIPFEIDDHKDVLDGRPRPVGRPDGRRMKRDFVPFYSPSYLFTHVGIPELRGPDGVWDPPGQGAAAAEWRVRPNERDKCTYPLLVLSPFCSGACDCSKYRPRRRL